MELLKNEKYEKYKKTVKLWEHDFKKANGRLPSKLDIKEADKSVRDAYCMYFKLKTAALEESLNDIFNFESDEQKEKPSETDDVTNDVEVPENIDKKDDKEDKVWGSHLNKPQKKISATVQKKDNMNSSFTQKLFSNSKFAKRNPRKSLNSSLKRNISIDASQIESSLNETVNVVEETEEEVKLKASLPVTTSNNVTQSQPVNVISELINKKGNIFNRNIDKGWLERVSANTVAPKSEETSTLDKHLDDLVYSGDESCDIISDSDVEDHPISKRIKLTHKNTSFNQNNSINIKSSNINKEIKSSDILNTLTVKRESVTTKPLEEPVTTKSLEKPVKEVVENKIFISDKSFVPENKVETAAVKNEEKSETVAASNVKKRKKNSSVKTRSSTRRTSRKTGKPPEKEDIIDDTYEPEFSHKPPPETVPRSKSLLSDVQNKPIEEIEKPKPFDKKQHSKEKLLKRIESGTLNENYVKIDIKKKIFVRGKKNMNFTKYKKQQWKKKKKSLYGDNFGCDGGTLTCFKCGKTGHFARQCKAEFMDKLLPLEAVGEEECPLPSLEQACQMAQENCLAVHVPNLKKTTSKDESESEKSSQPTKEIETDKEVLSSSEDESDKVDVFEFEEDEEFDEFALNNSFEVQSEKDVENSNIVKPYYELNPDGSAIDTPAEVYEALNKFGHSSFNFGQEQAIMRILSGLSTLVTLSTGSGKSLCYQLPAYLYAKRSKCITLVISPLISLMEDQVSGIPGFLKAACYHTMRSQTQRDKILHLLDDGEIDVLLVSPETIITGEKKSGFGSLLKRLPPIAFVCIDEAHCVSQWSHNFRSSYLMICRVLRERLGIKTVLGLTATSTRVTTISITKHLQIADDQAGVISDIPLPDNLHLSVSRDLRRDETLNNILTTEPFMSYDSIVIYCTRREECERIATYLRTSMRFATEPKSAKKYKSISSIAEPYHAGLSGSKRKTVQNAFMCGHLRIVVATIAFGMGINKSNIRGIIHYNMPKNFENYVQEVGRAGRDGLPAHCHLFLDSEGRDQHELRRHINANTTDRHVIRKLLKKIFVPCECKDYCPKHEVAFSVEDTVRELDVPEENISTLLCYLELHEKRYIETLTPAYIHCKIITYGSTQQLNKAAKECPPLAMALALHGKSNNKNNTFEFPVIDVAAAMGWDSGFVKRQLKSLEWTRENNAPKRTTLTVEFSNLGFHVRALGNLSSNELDDALDSLFAKKKEQELMSLKQLQIVHTTLTSVAEKSYNLCTTDEYQVKAKELKYKIRQYFSSDEPLKDVEVVYNTECNENQIAADVRSLITMYRDNNFTGRAVARIFHGIQSPNYPAVIWGRCKLWRAHLNTEFTKVHQIASREILKYK